MMKKDRKLDKKKFRIYTKNLNLLAARYLVDKKVIGRCSGRAEWGARALGIGQFADLTIIKWLIF